MRAVLGHLWRDENGATSIEYGLIAAFIGLVIINVLQAIGVELSNIFVDVEGGLKKRPAA